MNIIVKNKVKEFGKLYDKMPKYRKYIILGSIFLAILTILAQILMFSSIDKHNQLSEKFKTLHDQNADLLKQKTEITLKNSYKSEKSLLKQKSELLKDIENILRENKNSNYIPSENVPNLIEKIIGEVNQLQVISFRNTPVSESKTESNNILIEHNFSIKVSGSFQNIYDFLSKLEGIKGINISTVDIEKTNGVINANFNFYVLNTNKNILNF